MLISIVVPVYNNQGSLRLTFEQIKEQFEKFVPNDEYEVIFVNDGSKDKSLAELKDIRSQYRQVKIISFTRNFGQNSAMSCGFRNAKGNCVINISADLQDPIDLMPKMIEKWKEGYKIVACTREGREESLSRTIPAALYYAVLKYAAPGFPRKGFDYYLIDRDVLTVINPFNNRNSFINYDILETGYEMTTIPYIRRDRPIGKSGYSVFLRIKHAYNNILNASYLPIRLMSFLGAIIAATGFTYAGTVAYGRLHNYFSIPGYAPTIILILITSGINMMMLGIIGEYLWRTFDLVKARPDYVIKEKIMDDA